MTLLQSAWWYGIRDGDPRARGLLNRHYSKQGQSDGGRRPVKSLGPGEYMLLMTQDSLAVFGWIWNTMERDDGQDGVYCALFRNEGPHLSSDLIREADGLAWERWTHPRHFTYVDPDEVQSTNPGYCFLMAGWRRAGWSKSGKLLMECFR